MHQGNHHHPSSQGLPGTEAPSYHKSSQSQSYDSMCCLGSTSVVHLRSLWEEEIPEELWEEDAAYTARHHPVLDVLYTTQCRAL
ncbi:hypothetical protein PBY51_020418 [Eleginops maclovinus]|uniref:Uncharacterized protein n=1 Tax=Eleginops maclovinus TaxID=56733 RepID=A0AAN7XSK1_ELEMC|nr:hypothetical protein PBY51_020418 [Eleginops maclovinus]